MAMAVVASREVSLLISSSVPRYPFVDPYLGLLWMWPCYATTPSDSGDWFDVADGPPRDYVLDAS